MNEIGGSGREEEESCGREKPSIGSGVEVKTGSQELYKGSSILTAPHDAPTKEKCRAPKMEMVGKSARCRDGWKNQLSL